MSRQDALDEAFWDHQPMQVAGHIACSCGRRAWTTAHAAEVAERGLRLWEDNHRDALAAKMRQFLDMQHTLRPFGSDPEDGDELAEIALAVLRGEDTQ